MSKPNRALASIIFLALLSLGTFAFTGRADVTKASYTPVTTIVGVDTVTTGNSGSTLGAIDRCVSVPVDLVNPFYIDLFVMDVTDLDEWTGLFTYDETKLQVMSIDVQNSILRKNPDSGTVQAPPLDCTGGTCTFGGVDAAHAPDSGSGVLGRLQVKAIAAGISTAFLGQLTSLSLVTLAEVGGEPIGDLDFDSYFDGLAFNAIVAVGEPCPADADLDGFSNVEESIDGSDLLDVSSTPEICEGSAIDNDLDNLTDEGYDRAPVNGTPDCVDAASNSDGDGQANPSDSDDDNDGYTDAAEAYLATDSLADCRLTPYHSAWPLDMNNDGAITVPGDVLNYAGLIGVASGDDRFRKRLDLNGDLAITVPGDVLRFAGRIGTSCS